jgi:photosystem II stability/assembly factor-like uncharacterized protein
MFSFKDVNILKFFAASSLIVMLAACSSSNDGIVFDPDVAPSNVQVVSGDDNTGAVRNTISWTLVPAATNYAVYFGNTPGVTDSSSKIVTTNAVENHVTHSEVNVVVAGNPNYYRVQALSGEQSSILSAEVTGTPQESITDKALNDIAWNGIDTLVAVGAAGVILNSPNGVTGVWTDVSDVDIIDDTPEALTGVTWNGTQFLIVGAGLTVLTGDGSIGNTWSRQDLNDLAVTSDLEDVAWLGDQYIAVGNNGVIITSPDGIDWTLQNADLTVAGTTLNGVASDGNIIVAVGAKGTILTSGDGGETWLEEIIGNNSLNDITWDGNQFGVVGSNDTILTGSVNASNGVDWTSHIPGTPNITFVGASQWDYSPLPIDPVLAAVGSAGTFVVSPDAVNGLSIPTDADLLSGITWVDDGDYFVMVGNDGTVLTSQLQ